MPRSSTRQLINDPKWVDRMEQYFSFVDQEESGTITIIPIQNWATKMEKLCHATPHGMVALRAQLYTFWGKIGLVPMVCMTKEQFLQNANAFGMEEIKRKNNGIPTILEKCNNAWFDVVDSDKNGLLKLPELQAAMVATGLSAEGAVTWLQHMNKGIDGGINRDEYIASEHKFWYKAKGIK